MRRPHPRYDNRRKSWVTKAGGKLKTLAPGPRNAKTEALAWEAFYSHVASLGWPKDQAPAPVLTLGGLADEFGLWMAREVGGKRMAPATMEYYRRFVQQFLDAVGGHRPAASVLPIELERFKTTWHSVQTVQRLYNWGVAMRLIDRNPLKSVQRPEPGHRERILTPKEMVRLFRAADQPFRQFLLAARHTIARPQEIRALRWKDMVYDPVPMFVLQDFKGKRLRKRDKGVRKILLDDRMLRLLARLARRRNPRPDEYVFLNRRGKPWTGNAVRCRMRTLRKKLGFLPDDRGEQIVAYTFRHTAATIASARGVRDKLLAELMGHTRTSTTQRYQHFNAEHLHEAIQRAMRRRA